MKFTVNLKFVMTGEMNLTCQGQAMTH